MEVRNVENPSAPPASGKQTRPPSASIDSVAVSQRLQKELMSLMIRLAVIGRSFRQDTSSTLPPSRMRRFLKEHSSE